MINNSLKLADLMLEYSGNKARKFCSKWRKHVAIKMHESESFVY